MNKQEKETALHINVLLMALHYGDEQAFNSLIRDTENPADLLMGGLGALKNFVDLLLQAIEEYVDEMDVSFEDMVRLRGEYYTDQETED